MNSVWILALLAATTTLAFELHPRGYPASCSALSAELDKPGARLLVLTLGMAPGAGAWEMGLEDLELLNWFRVMGSDQAERLGILPLVYTPGEGDCLGMKHRVPGVHYMHQGFLKTVRPALGELNRYTLLGKLLQGVRAPSFRNAHLAGEARVANRWLGQRLVMVLPRGRDAQEPELHRALLRAGGGDVLREGQAADEHALADLEHVPTGQVTYYSTERLTGGATRIRKLQGVFG